MNRGIKLLYWTTGCLARLRFASSAAIASEHALQHGAGASGPRFQKLHSKAARDIADCVKTATWLGPALQRCPAVELGVFLAAACSARWVACGSPGGTLAVELYGGRWQLTQGVALGLASADSGCRSQGRGHGAPTAPTARWDEAHLVATFEGSPYRIPMLMGSLGPPKPILVRAKPAQEVPGKLRRALLPANASWGNLEVLGHETGSKPRVVVAVVFGSAYPMELCSQPCGRGSGTFWRDADIQSCLSCPLPRPGQSALVEMCVHFLGAHGRLDLVLLDSASPGVEEWFLLERFCRPRNVFLVNSALPLHQGWVADRLLRVPNSTWREVHSGWTKWSSVPWPGMLDLFRSSDFRLLADFSA